MAPSCPSSQGKHGSASSKSVRGMGRAPWSTRRVGGRRWSSRLAREPGDRKCCPGTGRGPRIPNRSWAGPAAARRFHGSPHRLAGRTGLCWKQHPGASAPQTLFARLVGPGQQASPAPAPARAGRQRQSTPVAPRAPWVAMAKPSVWRAGSRLARGAMALWVLDRVPRGWLAIGCGIPRWGRGSGGAGTWAGGGGPHASPAGAMRRTTPHVNGK